MNILTLSPIIIIIIAIVFFLITKKIFKALGFLLLISLIVFFISSILIYRDVQEFQNNFPNEEKLFLLEQNGNYAAGFIMSDLKNSQDVVLLGNQNINEIRPLTKHQILGDNYKLLIFKESAFNEVDNINFANKPLSKEETFTIINSNNTMEDTTKIMLDKSEVSEAQVQQITEQLSQQNINDESELRAVLFTSLIGSATKENKNFIINKIKSSGIEVYPRTLLFSVIKFIPDSVFNVVQKGQDIYQIKEVIV